MNIKPDPDGIHAENPWVSDLKREHGLSQNTFFADNVLENSSNFSFIQNERIDPTKYFSELGKPRENVTSKDGEIFAKSPKIGLNFAKSSESENSLSEDEENGDWNISNGAKRKPSTSAENLVQRECPHCGFTTGNRYDTSQYGGLKIILLV